MKKYVDYMDNVEPSPELREKLIGLRPERRRVPVYRAAALAAVAALALGVAGWALRDSPVRPSDDVPSVTDPDEEDKPDIPVNDDPVPENPDTVDPSTAPGVDVPKGGTAPTESGSWYRVTVGDTETAFRIPELTFIDVSDMLTVDIDYALWPYDARVRDVTARDIEAMFPCDVTRAVGDTLACLGWPSDAEIGGSVGFDAETGEVRGGSVYVGFEDTALSFEFLRGARVPDCEICPDGYTYSSYEGVEVRCYSWPGSGMAEVSFLAGDVGWKLHITGGDYVQLSALFVRLAVDSDGAVLGMRY